MNYWVVGMIILSIGAAVYSGCKTHYVMMSYWILAAGLSLCALLLEKGMK
jgi:hypothetical protein